MVSGIQNYHQAINAYQSAQQRSSAGVSNGDEALLQSGIAPSASVGNRQEDFANLVRSALNEAVSINDKAERLSIAGVNNQADMNTVITAVAEAEIALQTVVTIRDRVIEAYKEVARTPI